MNTLKAEKRSMDVKAKRLRREGFVTGNVFGKEIETSIPIQMLNTEVNKVLKNNHKGSQILLDVDGEQHIVLIKEIDYNTNTNYIDEMDFQALVKNEEVHSVAEIIPENYEKIQNGVFQLELKEVSYKALPAALVDSIKIDVGHMKVGDSILVKDLEISSNENITVLNSPDTVVAAVTVNHRANVPETTTEEEAE